MLQAAADRIAYTWFRLNPESSLGQSVHFFIYDSFKILVLLYCMMSFLGFLRTFISQKKLSALLTRNKRSHFFAALFGAATPFCSCSSIPVFISFMKAGIPLGVAFSFLVTSPLINEYLAVLMLGYFGFKVTTLYIISGMVLGIATGMIVGAMNLERFLEQDLTAAASIPTDSFKTFPERLRYGFMEADSTLKKLWLWILVGVAAGALIHNYVPQEFIEKTLSKSGIFSVPIVTLIGVPLYGSCAAIVPVAVVLFNKGVPLGTALSFMMAVSALSIPSAITLRRVMKTPLIAVFFTVTTVGIIFTGYFFNLF